MSFNFRQFLNESPQSIDSLNTDMYDKAANIKEGGKFLRRKREVYSETENSILFRTGMEHDGYIVLLDKNNNFVNYFVRFIHKKLDGEKYATQVAVWRTTDPTIPREEEYGIATKVFFDILLKKFDRIASDMQQTNDGRNFWMLQMARAARSGFKVGLLKVGTKEITYFDKNKHDSISDWVATLESTWGREVKYQRYRFIIDSKE